MELTQSTAVSRPIFMVQSADHVSGATGLTLTITAGKDGGTLSSITPTVTERSNGWYTLALTTSHTDTLGALALHITSTGADPLDFADQVVATGSSAPTAAAIRAEIDSNSTQLAALIGYVDTEIAAIVGYLDTEIAAIKAKTDLIPAAPAAVGDIPTATQNADALLKRDMSAVTGEAARSPLNALRWLRNKWAISAGTLTVFKENDSDAAWSAATTTTASDPTTAVDPS
jgi:hypothetical protein